MNDDIRQRIEARAEEARNAREAASLVAIKQLPLWADDIRGVPCAVLRGALFTVNREREVFKRRTLVASLTNMEIRFTGVRWNQSDLDVWENLVHIAKLVPLGERLYFSAHSLLKLLGRDVGGGDHETLKDDLTRLQGGIVEITWLDKRKTYSSGLVTKCFKDEETDMYALELPRELMSMYVEGTTPIHWEQRQRLGASSLAKWLHGFYASHSDPYAYKVKTLQKLCGSTTKDLRSFRQSLRIALDKLKDIGFVYRWEISDTDSVMVYKSARTSARAEMRRTNEGLNCVNHRKPRNADANFETSWIKKDGRNAPRSDGAHAWSQVRANS
jgi:TrfA protein